MNIENKNRVWKSHFVSIENLPSTPCLLLPKNTPMNVRDTFYTKRTKSSPIELTKKNINPLKTTHLVESLTKFLEWVMDHSNLDFCVALHAKEDDANYMDICQSYGKLHYHLKSPKTMDNVIKKNFNTALEETMNSQINYRRKCSAQVVPLFEESF